MSLDSFDHGRGALPLPACGEKAGVRGNFEHSPKWMRPLTRSPSATDLSPHAGRGKSGAA